MINVEGLFLLIPKMSSLMIFTGWSVVNHDHVHCYVTSWACGVGGLEQNITKRDRGKAKTKAIECGISPLKRCTRMATMNHVT
jgi:hypothetical protein